MKQKLLNSFRLKATLLVAVLCALFTGTAWGETSTLTFTAKCNGSGTADDNVSWTVTSDGTESNFDSNKGIHYGTNNAQVQYITLSTNGITGTITKIVVNASAASTVSASLNVTVGGNSFGTQGQSVSTTATDYTFTGSSSGAIVVTLTKPSKAAKAIYVKSVTVTYTTGSVTPTCATPTFNPAAGTYTSTQSVAISTATNGATIYYTTDGTDPTTSSSVYSSAIAVSSTTTIKAMAVADGMDNSAVASAAYTIVNLEHDGTQADPYTVADARTAIDAGVGTTDVYVAGIVCTGGSSLSSGAMNYWISDDGTETDKFEVYKGKGINNADFESTDDIQVGDVVVVKGNLTKYNTTYEFSAGSQLVSLDRPVTPSITANNVEIEYNATSGSIDFTVNNETQDGVLTAAITAGNEGSWLSLGAVTTSVPLTCSANDGNADRTATVTLTYTYNTNETVTKDVTVTQAHYVVDYATLPFEWAGGVKSDFEDLTGVTTNGLGSDYAESNSPYRIKFDTEGDYIQVKTNEQPGVVTVGVKMIGGDTSSNIIVKESADGETFTNVETLSISGAQNSTHKLETSNSFVSTSRYVRLYFNKGANVGVGAITIAQATSDPAIYAAASVELTAEATSGEIAYTISNPDGSSLTAAEKVDVDWISNVTVDAVNSKVTFTTTANTGAARTGTITLTYGSVTKDVTVTQAEHVESIEYTLATSITSGKHYVIASEGGMVMAEQKTNNRNAVQATLSGNTLTFASNAGVHEVVIYGPDKDNLYTIYDATDNGYLYAANSNNNYLKTQGSIDDNSLWAIEINETNASIVASRSSNRNVMQFNTNLFSCYASASQSAVYLYEKSDEATTTPTETVSVGSAGFTTYTTVNPVSFPSGVTAYIATQVNANTIHMETIESAPARTPVVIKAAAGSYTLESGTSTADVVSSNILKSSNGSVTGDESSIYALGKKNDVLGFYLVENGQTVPAGKAYLEVNSGSNVKGFTFDFGKETGIQSINNEQLTIDNDKAIFNLAGQRLSKMQKGINIVNGKKVLVK